MAVSAEQMSGLRSVAANKRAVIGSRPRSSEPAPLDQIDQLLGAISTVRRITAVADRDDEAARHAARRALTLMLRPPSSDSTGIMINTGPTTARGSNHTGPFLCRRPVRCASPKAMCSRPRVKIGHPVNAEPSTFHEFLEPIGVRHILAERDGIWLSGSNHNAIGKQPGRAATCSACCARRSPAPAMRGPGVVEAMAVAEVGPCQTRHLVRAIPLGRWSRASCARPSPCSCAIRSQRRAALAGAGAPAVRT